MDIWNSNIGVDLFDCSFFSDYTDENERFFIGGLQYFEFLTIHHIKRKEDYMAFIKPINMLAKMFVGFPFRISAIKKIDVECLSSLILNYLSSSLRAQICDQIAIYISNLFTNFVNNIEQIEINMDCMYKDMYTTGMFGYQLLQSLFFLFDDSGSSQTVNYSKLLQIFSRKVKQILVYNIMNEKRG